MVYQSNHSVYSTRGKHTSFLITLAEDISSDTYTKEPERYCITLSEIDVIWLMLT